jgi:phosphoserine aminotransferase
VFAYDIDWSKIDVATFSWQKVLGGEGGHGVLILGPRAVERLETYTPAWPLPKVFRLVSKGKLAEGVFKGETINTPSMLAVEDAIFALEWAKGLGGLGAEGPQRRQCRRAQQDRGRAFVALASGR